MNDLFLIAHKVRGEPAFDVAQRMDCPMCDGHKDIPGGVECFECDGLGYWWIIPTSGHRAYPWWHGQLDTSSITTPNESRQFCHLNCLDHEVPPMPSGWPDHYSTKPAPKIDLLTKLGIKAPPSPPIKRRV